MNENLILQTLMEMKEDLGAVKTDVKVLVGLETRVASLEEQSNQAKGGARALLWVSGLIGGIVAFIVSNWSALTNK
jgi:hypothetical protein